MGSTLKGKNLLLEEQILSYKHLPLLKKGGKNSGSASFESIIHILFIRGIFTTLYALYTTFNMINEVKLY